MRSSFGEILKQLRTNRSISQQELADILEVSRSAIGNYEQNIRTPDHEQMEVIADYFNVDMDYLYGRSVVQNRYQATHNKSNMTTVDKLVEIPILGSIACGEPLMASDNVIEYRHRPSNELPSGDLFYLRAKGNSMLPTIPDKSLVLCRSQEDVENGEIAAVLVNNETEATLKKIRKFETSWVLEPLNREYEPIVINGGNTCRIIGKVLEVTVKLGG